MISGGKNGFGWSVMPITIKRNIFMREICLIGYAELQVDFVELKVRDSKS